MRLWIGLYLPLLPLEALRPRWSEPGPHVVVEQGRVLCASGEARAAGVEAGMRQAGVSAICPQAMLHERVLLREEKAMGEVALALLQYTPEVALADEHSLLMDVGASLRAFGGRLALCRKVRASVHALGFSLQLGMAPTARGAWLLARFRSTRATGSRRRVIKLVSLVRRLDGLAYAVLPPVREHDAWLQGIGCRTLGDVRRLPRAGLQRRSSKEVIEQLDQAYGEAPELFDFIVPPPSFAASLELPDRIDKAPMVIAGAHRLLAQMTGWLAARQAAVARFTLLLQHERGRCAVPPTPVEILLAEPAWQEEHMLRVLTERLGRVELEAPVIGLKLEAGEVSDMALQSDALFPEPGGSALDFKRLLELLAARLGPDNILLPAPLADHRPERANRWVSAIAAGKSADAQGQAVSLERPFWLLPEPLALPLRGHRPFYGSPLQLLAGPERIECGWWDGEAVQRDYFIAQGGDHGCYWIFRERCFDELRWFLHGVFG